jgi:hypothetical protein
MKNTKIVAVKLMFLFLNVILFAALFISLEYVNNQELDIGITKQFILNSFPLVTFLVFILLAVAGGIFLLSVNRKLWIVSLVFSYLIAVYFLFFIVFFFLLIAEISVTLYRVTLFLVMFSGLAIVVTQIVLLHMLL